MTTCDHETGKIISFCAICQFCFECWSTWENNSGKSQLGWTPIPGHDWKMNVRKVLFLILNSESVPATRKVQTARQAERKTLWGIFHKLFSLNICLDEFLSFCNLVHFLWNPVWLWRSMCLKLNQKSLNCQVAQRLFMCFPSTSGCYRFLYFQMSPFCEGLSKHFWILSFLVLSSESIL